MVNDFKIKKHWIAALCAILFSLASFSQGLSDTTIGFNLSKETEVLKKQGFKDDVLTKEIARLRKIKMANFIVMKNKEAAIIQDNKTKPASKSKTTNKTIVSLSQNSKLSQTEMECGYHDYRAGQINLPYNSEYGDLNGIKINTLNNLTFYKYYTGTNGTLSYEWKLYDNNGNLIDSKTTSNFPITLTNIGKYKVTLKLTDDIGCSEFERTLEVRDSNACIISPDERFGSINLPNYQENVLVNSQSLITFYPSGFNTTGFNYKWELLNSLGQNVATSTENDFAITPNTLGSHKINLTITDPNGCSTKYEREIESVDECVFNKNKYDLFIDVPNVFVGYVGQIKAGQTAYIAPGLNWSFYNEFTFKWKLYNPSGDEILTSNTEFFSFILKIPGYHKIVLEATNKVNGCVYTAEKVMNCLIENSCTNNNLKSAEVKVLYDNFIKKLIKRVILGETDQQVDATIASPEFMALKPYIKNAIGDKIYNFVSLRDEYGVIGINFSFSPDREYDIHIYDFYGIRYNPEYDTLEDLDYSIESSVYTDITQYQNPDDYFVSCYVINPSKKKNTGKVILKPYECSMESEVRNIIFCPGEGSHCTPEIVGTIKSNFPFIYPKTEYSFYFETIIPNLTYSWSITSETGEVLSTSDADITTPYRYTFLNEGIYFVKLTAKNELGCTTNFTKKIIVDNKRCANDSNNFTFETEENGVTYIWTTTDINGNIVDTITNTTGTYSFSTNTAGTYEVKLTANAEKKCETVFAKTIFIENCTPVVVVSCTQNNPLTPKIHQLFINLINKAATTPNGVDVNTYAKTEIAALAPYTFGPNAKIFNFSNDSSSVSFSFTENYTGIDVYIPKSSQGTITGIDLSKYESSSSKTIVETNYTNGSSNLTNGYVTNIDFCPSVDCTPITGVINIVKRGTASTNKKTNSSSKI